MVTSFGTGAFDAPAAADGELVQRLRAAGAVIIGKTTLPELAICGFTESQRWGITRNPWDTERTPGGSSGGSGAAVAAGLVGAASASDGGGSIRIPAAFCGLFGLKPQRGRMPLDAGRPLVGPVGARLPDPHGARHRAVPRRDRRSRRGRRCAPAPERPYAEAARTRPPTAADRDLGPARPADRAADRHRRGPRRACRDRGAAARARPPGRAPGPEATASPATTSSRATCAAPTTTSLRSPTRSGSSLARAASPASAGSTRRRSCGACSRTAEADAERMNRVFDHCDVLITPTVGEPPIEVGRWRGKGALDAAGDEPHLLLHAGLEPHRPAGRRGARGVHGCRPAAVGEPRRSPPRRAHAALARGPDRGRAPVGGSPPAGQPSQPASASRSASHRSQSQAGPSWPSRRTVIVSPSASTPTPSQVRCEPRPVYARISAPSRLRARGVRRHPGHRALRRDLDPHPAPVALLGQRSPSGGSGSARAAPDTAADCRHAQPRIAGVAAAQATTTMTRVRKGSTAGCRLRAPPARARRARAR